MNFDAAFAYLLKDEGMKYTHDPKDPGGPTKFGVTQKAYAAHLGREVPDYEIETLPEESAKEFYRVRYWQSLCCDKIKSEAVAICIFDSSVLYGVGTAARIAQLAVSRCGATVKFDGILGEKTVALINVVREGDFLKSFHTLLIERIDQVIRVNPNEEKFRNGWTNRADRLLALSTQTQNERS